MRAIKRYTLLPLAAMFLCGGGSDAMAATVHGYNEFETNYMYLFDGEGDFVEVTGFQDEMTGWSVVDETPYLLSVTGIHLPESAPNDGYLGDVASPTTTWDVAIQTNDVNPGYDGDEYYVEALYSDNAELAWVYAGGWGTQDHFSGTYDDFMNSDIVPGEFKDTIIANVPLPGALWLLSSGLVGIAAFRRKKALG